MEIKKNMVKIISWNVNGLNSTIKKGFLEYVAKEDADVVCLQETKVSNATIDKKMENLQGYNQYWNTAEKNGYSGVMTLTKEKPLSIQEGMGISEFDKEGRLLTVEFSDYYLINGYLPNAGRGLIRLDFKLNYNKNLVKYLEKLRKKKDIILTGDLNVAHKEIDLANPKSNTKTAGFTPEERASFTKLLSLGYIDTFREFEKDGGNYTYWSYRTKARERNVGWRLDYFVVNKNFLSKVVKSEILSEIMGSDHCPIRLLID
jgi:exodeoxyribonuclease III